ALAGQPALVNTDAEGKAWFFKIKLANAAELGSLMDRTAYHAFIKETVHDVLSIAQRRRPPRNRTSACSIGSICRTLGNELEVWRACLHLCHVHVELQ